MFRCRSSRAPQASVRLHGMKIHDLKDEEGRVFAFEVANFGRKRVCNFIAKIPNAKVLRGPEPWGLCSNEEFCEFEVDGQLFIVWEPFGDNSRYWIGPKPPKWCPQVALVRESFRTHKAFWLF